MLLRNLWSEVLEKVLLTLGGLIFWGARIMTGTGNSVYRGKDAILGIVESTMGHRDLGWQILGHLDERVCYLPGQRRSGASTPAIGRRSDLRRGKDRSSYSKRGGYGSSGVIR